MNEWIFILPVTNSKDKSKFSELIFISEERSLLDSILKLELLLEVCFSTHAYLPVNCEN